ncbi:MAG TPA: flagellar protein FlbB [Patescibacteria group bacterium]|nr:flagellar protein FlbB [Patescibacteria group bacterium]
MSSEAPKKRKLRPFGIFSMLMVVAGVAFAFRLVNVVSVIGEAAEVAGITRAADAQEAAPGENPPPLTADELKKAAANTGQKPDDAPAEAAKPVPVAASSEPQPNPPPPDDADLHAYSATEVEVLQSLGKRRDELDAREKKIAEREALLDAAGQEVDHKIAELNKLKGEIEALLGKQQKMEEERINSLVKIYEGMKPKEAANIFNTLDMDVLLEIVGRMNVRKTSPILEAMDPDKARIVTIRLSEKEKLPVAGSDLKKNPALPPDLPASIAPLNLPPGEPKKP